MIDLARLDSRYRGKLDRPVDYSSYRLTEDMFPLSDTQWPSSKATGSSSLQNNDAGAVSVIREFLPHPRRGLSHGFRESVFLKAVL